MDTKRLEDGSVQTYVTLSLHQIQKVRELFDISEREDITQAVQKIVELYLEEHTRDDVKKIQSDDTWKDFTNKFNEGWFNK